MSDEITMNMSPAQYAQAMTNRVARERKRIAQKITEFAATEAARDTTVQAGLYALADEIAGEPARAVPIEVPQPQREQEPELPPVRHYDDFEEGVSLIRSRGVGVTGRLRD